MLGSGFVPETAGDALEDRRGDPDSRTGVVDLRAHCDRALAAQPANAGTGTGGHRGEAFLGVLTRDAGMTGDAEIAQLVDNGHMPPLEELLAMDNRGKLPWAGQTWPTPRPRRDSP